MANKITQAQVDVEYKTITANVLTQAQVDVEYRESPVNLITQAFIVIEYISHQPRKYGPAIASII